MESIKTILAVIVTVGIIIAVIIGLQVKNTPIDQTLSLTPNSELSENTSMTKAIFETNLGTITIALDTENTPITAENFKKLAESGFYNGTRFHRIIEDFMIQGGDPQSADVSKKDFWGTGGPGYQFADEIKETNNNAIGTISMANAGPNTNGSQFFINTANNNFLDPKHTVFGKVVEGMDIVEKISQSPTDDRDRPLEDVIISKITIE